MRNVKPFARRSRLVRLGAMAILAWPAAVDADSTTMALQLTSMKKSTPRCFACWSPLLHGYRGSGDKTLRLTPASGVLRRRRRLQRKSIEMRH